MNLFFSFIPRATGAVISSLLVFAAARARAEEGTSPFDRAATPFAYEFAVGDLGWKTSGPFTGWTKNFRKNPIPYRMTTVTLGVSHPVKWRHAVWRRCEFVHSLVWSSITSGPESHWAGIATGLRYRQPLPEKWRSSIYASFQGGVGGIDSSGQKYAQAKDLTFAYLAAIGVRTQISASLAVHVQVLGQHISNGWQTRPSEGIDCSGWSLAFSYRPMRRR